MLPSEIRATTPLYFNDYAAGNFSRGIFHLYAALPPCYDMPVLKHQAFRSEQSRHGWKAINSFSL